MDIIILCTAEIHMWVVWLLLWGKRSTKLYSLSTMLGENSVPHTQIR